MSVDCTEIPGSGSFGPNYRPGKLDAADRFDAVKPVCPACESGEPHTQAHRAYPCDA